jgi:hypothetical protein
VSTKSVYVNGRRPTHPGRPVIFALSEAEWLPYHHLHAKVARRCSLFLNKLPPLGDHPAFLNQVLLPRVTHMLSSYCSAITNTAAPAE